MNEYKVVFVDGEEINVMACNPLVACIKAGEDWPGVRIRHCEEYVPYEWDNTEGMRKLREDKRDFWDRLRRI